VDREEVVVANEEHKEAGLNNVDGYD